MYPVDDKKTLGGFSVEEVTIGPLLARVLLGQQHDEESTSYPFLASLSVVLIRVAEELSYPLIWPVGAAAERLAGAASVLSKGALRLVGWTEALRGKPVLLLTVTSVSPLPLLMAAEKARLLGAGHVHACGVWVQGIDSSVAMEGLDSYQPILPLGEDALGFADPQRQTAIGVSEPDDTLISA
jgi:hypothetical protein